MSFFGNMMDNMKNSLNRDKELREKLEQLEREAKKLEENEALKRAKESLDKAKVKKKKKPFEICFLLLSSCLANPDLHLLFFLL